MNNKEAMDIANRVFETIFRQKCPYNLEQILSEFAFDIKLPQKVIDSTTGEETWASSINPTKFITQKNSENFNNGKGWMLKKREINSREVIIKLWKKVNFKTTERIYD